MNRIICLYYADSENNAYHWGESSVLEGWTIYALLTKT